MKIIIILITGIFLININKLFASENPLVKITGDLAGEVIIMVLKIGIPLCILIGITHYFKDKK